MKRLFLLSVLIVGMLTSFPAKAISTYPNAHLTAIQIDSLPSEAQRVRYKEILEHEASGLVDAHTLQIRNSTLEWLEAQGLLGSPQTVLSVLDAFDVIGTEANVNSRDAETFALILREKRALTEVLIQEAAMEYIQAAKLKLGYFQDRGEQKLPTVRSDSTKVDTYISNMTIANLHSAEYKLSMQICASIPKLRKPS